MLNLGISLRRVQTHDPKALQLKNELYSAVFELLVVALVVLFAEK